RSSVGPRRLADISGVCARPAARLWPLPRGEPLDSSNSPRRSDHKRGRSGGRGTVRDASGSAEVEVELPRRRVLELDGDAPVLLVEMAGRVERDLSAGLTVTGGGASGQMEHAAVEVGVDDDVAAEPFGSPVAGDEKFRWCG